MLKAVLQETLPGFKYDLQQLAANSGLTVAQISRFIDPSSPDEPTTSQFSAIIRALPVSIVSVVSEALKDEIGYVDAQLELMESNCDDSQVPMFSGMRRILQRMVAG